MSAAPSQGGGLPSISIVTPSLNQSGFLAETIDSVVGQGYPALDYVVVDGGSSDDSVDVIRRHEEGIARWVSEPDDGHAAAIDKGFAMTSGEIMAWINSSDIYFPWTLVTVGEVFRDLPEVEWITGMQSHFAEGVGPKAVVQDVSNRYDLLAGQRFVQQESVFWRRSLWEKAGGSLDETFRLACDHELWLRFSRHADLYHVGTLLASFRYHDDGRGSVLRREYLGEVRRAIDAESARLSECDRRRVGLVRRLGSRRRALPALVAKSGLLPWYRHARVAYDFARARWTVR
jgi:glycosyltransferase involved in cell wall biosynthesis